MASSPSSSHEIRVERVLRAPIDDVFAAFTEPDWVASMPGVRGFSLLRDGIPERFGLGHRREVLLNSGRYIEEITGWDPPHRFDYRIIEASVPIEHEGGYVSLQEVDGGTKVEWVSVFRVKVPLIGELVVRWADGRMEDDLGRHLDFIERRLAAPRVRPVSDQIEADRPTVASRYLNWAMDPEAEFAQTADIDLVGRIRLGRRWCDFESNLSVRSLVDFRWQAKVHAGLVGFAGHDEYADGQGEMLWRLYGLIPVMKADDDDLSHSARGRAALEQIFLPPALARPEVTWTETDDGWARAAWELDGEELAIELLSADDGSLRAVRMQRWSDAEGMPWRFVSFGADIQEAAHIDGLGVPLRFSAGWFYGSERYAPFFEGVVRGITLAGAPEQD